MAYIDKTAFQPRIWNNRNNDLQNVPAVFETGGAADDCAAGFLCVIDDTKLSNGNLVMKAATDGNAKIYACNPGDVQRGIIGNGLYAEGVETLGLGLPKNRLGTFTEMIPGETYAFREGNFASAFDGSTNKFATVANGKLTPAASAPAAGSGIYFELNRQLGIDNFTEGNGVAGKRYNMVCRKTADA